MRFCNALNKQQHTNDVLSHINNNNNYNHDHMNNEKIKNQTFPVNHTNLKQQTNGNNHKNNVNMNNINNNNNNEDLEDLKRFERRVSKTKKHQHQQFDPDTLNAMHQQHHHNHNHLINEDQFIKTNQIHEAAVHSKPLNYNVTSGKSQNLYTNGTTNEIFNKLYNLNKKEVLRTAQDLESNNDDYEDEEYESGSDSENAHEYILSTQKTTDYHNLKNNILNDDSVDVSNLISQFRLATSNSKLSTSSSREPNLVHDISNSSFSSTSIQMPSSHAKTNNNSKNGNNSTNCNKNSNSEIQIL